LPIRGMEKERECSTCLKECSKHDFSKKQWKISKFLRFCNNCLSKREKSLECLAPSSVVNEKKSSFFPSFEDPKVNNGTIVHFYTSNFYDVPEVLGLKDYGHREIVVEFNSFDIPDVSCLKDDGLGGFNPYGNGQYSDLFTTKI